MHFVTSRLSFVAIAIAAIFTVQKHVPRSNATVLYEMPVRNTSKHSKDVASMLFVRSVTGAVKRRK